MGKPFANQKWGITFSTTLSPEKLSDLIAQEAHRLGYRVESCRGDDQAISIEMSLPDPVWKSICRRLPAHVSWRIWRDGETTFLYRDTKMSRAYGTMLILSCLACSTLLWFGAETLVFRDWLEISTIRLFAASIASFTALSLLFINYGLLLGGSSGRLASEFESLRREALVEGSFLVEGGRGVSLRLLLHFAAYLVFVFATVFLAIFAHAGPASQTFSDPIPSKWAVVLVALLAFIVFLLAALPMMVRFPASSRRLVSALGGISTSIAVLLVLLGQTPWSVSNRRLTYEHVQTVLDSSAYIRGDWKGPPPKFPDGTIALPAQVKRVYNAIWIWAWCSLMFGAFMFACAVGFLLLAFNSSLRSWPVLYQISQRPDIPSSEQTASASDFLTLFRIVWGSSWFILMVTLAWAMINLIGATSNLLESITRSDVAVTLNGVDVSVFFTSVAFNMPSQSRTLSIIVLSGWFLYLLTCWGLFTTSVGSYFAQETRTLRQLRGSSANPNHDAQKIIDRVASLSRRLSNIASPPQVLLIENRVPYAQARRIGFLRTHNIIEISSRCSEIFNGKELEAMLAHELAHHALGHCRKDRVLRFLGRMTFVGDGFVRILENSFGYELKADQFAISELRADPEALISCMQKTRIITAIENLSIFSEATGLAMDAHSDNLEKEMLMATATLSQVQRLKLGAKIFLQQYLGRKHSGYWHPALNQRIEALREFSSTRN